MRLFVLEEWKRRGSLRTVEECVALMIKVEKKIIIRDEI